MDITSVNHTSGEVEENGWTKNSAYNPPDGWVEARENTLDAVREERRQQFIKWGKQVRDNGTWLKILCEEFGEVAEAMLDLQFPNPKGGKTNEEKIAHLRLELIQVSAVAAAIVQQIDTGSS